MIFLFNFHIYYQKLNFQKFKIKAFSFFHFVILAFSDIFTVASSLSIIWTPKLWFRLLKHPRLLLAIRVSRGCSFDRGLFNKRRISPGTDKSDWKFQHFVINFNIRFVTFYPLDVPWTVRDCPSKHWELWCSKSNSDKFSCEQHESSECSTDFTSRLDSRPIDFTWTKLE